MSNRAPRHRRVADTLRRRIVEGALPPGTRLPPEAALFRQLGASSTTVVRALNELVREGLIVRRRGSGTFVADPVRPPLIPGRTLKLGILWYHAVDARHWERFCHRLSRGAMQAWGLGDLEPEFASDRAETFTRATWRQPARGLTVECVGGAGRATERVPHLNTVRDAGYDGVLTAGIVDEDWLEQWSRLRVPTVIADFPSQRFAARLDQVYADPHAAYREAVRYYADRGLRRIHFVGGCIAKGRPAPEAGDSRLAPSGGRIDPDALLRCAAWRQALQALDLPAPEAWVHYGGADGQLVGAALARLPAAERPQVVLCHSRRQAEGIAREFAAQDCPLEAVGVEIEREALPTACCRLDALAMGAVAAEQLIARLQHPDRPVLNIGVHMQFDPGHPHTAARIGVDREPQGKPGAGP